MREGYQRLTAYAAETGIPLEPLGALLVAWDAEQLAALPSLAEKAVRNGYDETSILDADAVYAREPHLGPGALGALEVPGESIICPWTTTLAYATQAVRAGVALHLNCPPEPSPPARTTTRSPPRAGCCAPVTSSTPLGCTRTRSTGGWATRSSP
ncbi:hypothetical protein GCM10017744_012190 [Streptomyces antimycoticus]